ncbi:MAG TPA: amidohydrolase family protein [Clostridia bacterium]|nr:amidohydrolase family protein [Clostridia bacterium]
MQTKKALRGNVVFAPAFHALTCVENGYIVTENGMIEGIYEKLPGEYRDIEVEDYGDKLIIPSFCDMHLHAPQYPMLGMGMDLQLLEWLNRYTFKTEARFSDTEYARRVYRVFASELIKKGTTRVVMFSSVHREATHVLMEELERAGVTGYVGKVNMDRNCPDSLRETTEESLIETRRFITECEGRYRHLRPILTPRFTPTCSNELMQGLGELKKEYGLRVQSHLSENREEMAWVKELHPDCELYYQTYEKYGLWSENTIMAHCVYSCEEERAAMKKRGVIAAHCPDSNMNIASGLAPVRQMLEEGMHVVLGSDIAGGALLSMRDTLTSAVRTSKMRWLNSGKKEDFLTATEAFYLATSAGQSYFNAGPGFQKGDALHALVLDDSRLPETRPLTLTERLERLMYASSDDTIVARYSEGALCGRQCLNF